MRKNESTRLAVDALARRSESVAGWLRFTAVGSAATVALAVDTPNEHNEHQGVTCDREVAAVGRILSITQDRVKDASDATTEAATAQLFTASQLSRILDVPVRRIHSWVRHGLLESRETANRLRWFEFRQVVSARCLRELSQAVGPAVIRRAVDQLASHGIGLEHALGQLQPGPRGLLWRREDGRLSDLNGQLQLDFGGPERQAVALPVARSHVAARSPAEWFELGIEAEEEDDLDLAQSAYRKAVAAAPDRAEYHFNLGNVQYSLGARADAIRSYSAAVERDPEYVEAWNNVGNVLCEVGQMRVASEVYRRALAIEPGYADAHYNLAETLADRGDLRGAHEHWRAYLRLDPHSAWSMQVRDRLRGGTGRLPRLASWKQN